MTPLITHHLESFCQTFIRLCAIKCSFPCFPWSSSLLFLLGSSSNCLSVLHIFLDGFYIDRDVLHYARIISAITSQLGLAWIFGFYTLCVKNCEFLGTVWMRALIGCKRLNELYLRSSDPRCESESQGNQYTISSTLSSHMLYVLHQFFTSARHDPTIYSHTWRPFQQSSCIPVVHGKHGHKQNLLSHQVIVRFPTSLHTAEMRRYFWEFGTYNETIESFETAVLSCHAL